MEEYDYFAVYQMHFECFVFIHLKSNLCVYPRFLYWHSNKAWFLSIDETLFFRTEIRINLLIWIVFILASYCPSFNQVLQVQILTQSRKFENLHNLFYELPQVKYSRQIESPLSTSAEGKSSN